jgi:hypothetical protein
MAELAERKDYLDMSDEELMKIDPSTIPNDEPTVEVEAVADEVEDAPEQDTSEAVAEEVAAPDDEDKEEVADKEDASNDAKDPADKAPEPKEDEAKKDEVVVDYKAEYERLLTPFKANGREIAVQNIDDAISLMQMGANYNKKMAALKPNLKLMKMLENNGLLSEEKISFLIDVEKKSPSAINKLVKDSGLDPMDLDTDKTGDYTPKTYAVDDREMELDTVLDSLQESPSYTRTLDIVTNKWDGASKQVIASMPQLLTVINDHVERGIYDTIMKEVERERVFGRLSGMADIDAYRSTGDAIQARGGFNSLGHQGKAAPTAPVVIQPKAKANDDVLKDKKRAAGGSKPAASSQVNKDFNPLSMSDEEFGKLAQSKYI